MCNTDRENWLVERRHMCNTKQKKYVLILKNVKRIHNFATNCERRLTPEKYTPLKTMRTCIRLLLKNVKRRHSRTTARDGPSQICAHAMDQHKFARPIYESSCD